MVPSHAYIFAPSATGRYPLEGIENKEMKVENTKAQMRKGVLEYCILSHTGARGAVSPDIIAKLKEAKLIVVEGTLYPLLTRLKDSGCSPTGGKNPIRARPANTTSSPPWAKIPEGTRPDLGGVGPSR
jgi:hypothetical protein